MNSQDVKHVGIAHRHIKERRARRIVPIAPGGTLADYVPFYFAPRSPMLFAIHTGSVEGYTEGQIEVLHLVTSVETIQKKKFPFAFTDGHAEIAFSRFYDDVSALDQIDWDIIKATYWNDTDQDNDKKRRRQAEFLVYQFFPWELVEEIGVINDTVAERVKGILSSLRKYPEVMIQKKWYY